MVRSFSETRSPPPSGKDSTVKSALCEERHAPATHSDMADFVVG